MSHAEKEGERERERRKKAYFFPPEYE